MLSDRATLQLLLDSHTGTGKMGKGRGRWGCYCCNCGVVWADALAPVHAARAGLNAAEDEAVDSTQ
jgi:hypothetical protein